MPKVIVKYLSFFREMAGKEKEEFSLPEEATVKTLLDELTKKYGDSWKELVDPDKPPEEGLLITVNSSLLKLPADLELKLRDGDQVIIGFPPFGG